jgi:isocitrate dehydrogenase
MKQNIITVAYGDGIGPEIMEAVLKILKHTNTGLKIESIEVGEELYKRGFTSGITNESWETVMRNKVVLKAPITTPLGKGYKSLNVTFRRMLGLFANVRPAPSYHPFVGRFKNMNVVIIRENEEGLYSGIEYRLTPNSSMAMKIVSTSACEKIIRYAFEYARINHRKKITCITKSNILKITDGAFQEIFEKIALEYPDIITDHMLVDIAAARLAARPETFDVIVTLNLYGDVLSDIASEISGSVGLAGSANIGEEHAMFEAVHGSAPNIAGKNIANPSGLLNAAVMMLRHLGKNDTAEKINNALLKTIEDGYHTEDIYTTEKSKQKLSTTEFTDAVINHLGSEPKLLASKFKAGENNRISIQKKIVNKPVCKLIGVDVFLKTDFSDEEAEKLNSLDNLFNLHIVSSRGLMIWPNGVVKIKSDFYRYRFIKKNNDVVITQDDILKLVRKISELKLEILSIINLSTYDDSLGFSLSQGE